MKTSLEKYLTICISSISTGLTVIFILSILGLIVYGSVISFIYISIIAIGIVILCAFVKLSCMFINKVLS